MINKVEKMYDPQGIFGTYKITNQDGTILYVPNDKANSDYQEIQEWAKIEGNNIIDNGAQTMFFGAAAFSQIPFATTVPLDAQITATANPLTFAIGNVNISANNVIEVVAADPLDITSVMPTVTTTVNITANSNALTLNLGSSAISGDANITASSNALTTASTQPTVTGSAVVNVEANPLSFTVNDVGVIVWNPIDPGPTNVWVEIKPYGGTP